MKNKIIGFDLDGTLVRFVNPFWCEAEKVLHMKSGSIKPPTIHGINQYSKTIRDTMYGLFTNNIYMTDLKTLPFSEYIIDWLKKEKYKIYIITARHIKVRKSTVSFIKCAFNIPESNVRFVNPYESKANIFENLMLDYWVDDNEHDVSVAVSLGIRTFHITNTPWGHNVVDKAHRVNSLYGLMENLFKKELV